MVALALTTLPERHALMLARGWFVSTYIHSGLSKLDVSFCRELGSVFLNTLARPVWAKCCVVAVPLAVRVDPGDADG